MIKHKVLKDSKLEPTAKTGAIVYPCQKYDYGMAMADTWMLGIECISVTLNKDGGYPFFTIPRQDLEELDYDS